MLPSSSPLAFSADFYETTRKRMQWKAFLRKSGLKADCITARNLESGRGVYHAGGRKHPQETF